MDAIAIRPSRIDTATAQALLLSLGGPKLQRQVQNTANFVEWCNGVIDRRRRKDGDTAVPAHAQSRRRPAAPVRQLLRRLLRCRLRSSAGRPGRAAASFGYDQQSYSQNFDDGIGSGHRF
uniref:Uncharacterized protein n=1 Tax=Setaria viridis TaxID=4556 RepID=A0A4U6SWZ8_SETVI|nr:hypothetical protein SEVIR_9G227300v2 [Setaria viridis]TKV93470.1 hypothetical protein SEVIR_9G227300v2 [Setaria viridis]